MLQQFIGDRTFYRRIMTIAVPIIIQNTITNFVSLLDNIMVGQVGTLQMSGVATVNLLLFVFNLCIFGAGAGAGIFTAQFYGCQDHENIRHTFRFKILVGLVLTAVGIALFYFFGSPLIQLYLNDEENPTNAALTLEYGLSYLEVMLWGLLPFALSNAYSGTLRETGQATVPMIAGIAAVAVNLGLNYVLIFGHFGAPAMGVRGAAFATVISRYVELIIVATWTHLNPQKNPFIAGAYRSMRIPGKLLKPIILRGMPLMLNEFFWSTGNATLNQCFSLRGLEVVAATNITSTLFNLGSVVMLSMGVVVGISTGQLLGAGESEETVRDSYRKNTFLSVCSCIVIALIMAGISGLFPRLYNTTDNVRNIATALICFSALFMPFTAFVHTVYFALRSGGRAIITFLFDTCFMWVCVVPLAFCLSRFTDLPIVPLYALCLGTDLLKCVIGYFIIRSKSWIRNLTHI